MDSKIKVVYYDLENNLATETFWATKEGEFYRIKNIPFFAPNLALDDLISVEEDDDELYFDDLIELSGHSTIQIVILSDSEKNRIIEQLEHLGCHWKGMHNQMYLSVDIPPQLEYLHIKFFLDEEAKNLALDYKEACLSTYHRS